jgi:hypothetical protein
MKRFLMTALLALFAINATAHAASACCDGGPCCDGGECCE